MASGITMVREECYLQCYVYYCDNYVSVVSESYGLLGSNDIHNASCATVVKVIDLRDNRLFCPAVEKSARPLRRLERKMAYGRPL